jgi:hypothetical protein
VVSCSCGIGRWWRKIIGCVVEFLVTVSFRNLEDQFAWAFALMFMVQMLMVIDGFYGMNCLVC